MYVHIFFQQCPIMYRPEFYILPTKYVKKKHAIGYIHEHSYFGFEGSGHFNFSPLISKLVDFKFLFTNLFLVQKLETLMEWNRKIFRANFHVLNHIFSHFFTFHSYFLDMITYSIVASTNTCYYRGSPHFVISQFVIPAIS